MVALYTTSHDSCCHLPKISPPKQKLVAKGPFSLESTPTSVVRVVMYNIHST